MISLAASLPNPAPAMRGTAPVGAVPGAAVAFALPAFETGATLPGLTVLPAGRQADAVPGEVLPALAADAALPQAMPAGPDLWFDTASPVPIAPPVKATVPAPPTGVMPVDPRFSQAPVAGAVDAPEMASAPLPPVVTLAVRGLATASSADLAPAGPEVMEAVPPAPAVTPDRPIAIAPPLRPVMKAPRRDPAEKPALPQNAKDKDGMTESAPDTQPALAAPPVAIESATPLDIPRPEHEQAVQRDVVPTAPDDASVSVAPAPSGDASPMPAVPPAVRPVSTRMTGKAVDAPAIAHGVDTRPAAAGSRTEAHHPRTIAALAPMLDRPVPPVALRPLPPALPVAAQESAVAAGALPTVLSPVPAPAIATADDTPMATGSTAPAGAAAILHPTPTPVTIVPARAEPARDRGTTAEAGVPWRFAAAPVAAPAPATTVVAPTPVTVSAAPAAVMATALSPEVKPEATARLPVSAPVVPAAGPVTQTIAPAIVAAAGAVFAPAIAVADDLDRRVVRGAATTATDIAAIGAATVAAPVAVDAGSQAPLDLSQPRWPQAMVDRIEMLRDAADAADTRIRLVPDALGAIEIGLTREGDTIHVRFTAEQATTAALLHEAQPRLAEAADQRGLKLGQTSVETGTASTQQTATQQQGQQQGQQTSGGGMAQSQANAQPQSQGQGRQPQPATPTRPAGAGSTTTAENADDDARIA